MSVSAPLDLGQVIEQVHFAYRQEGTAWTAGHSTWGVRVEQGALEFTPFHFPRAQTPSGDLASVAGAPVRFGAAELRRGNRVIGDAAPGAVRVGAQGQLQLDRGAVTETLKNTEAGVEQSWSFAALPVGTAPLELRVPVLQGRFLTATTGGLHFEAGALRVRYGHATWVESTGRRTTVLASFEDGAVVMRVPQDVLAASAFPAVLDPVIGPELAVDTPVVGPSGTATAPAVASNGSTYLVVWQDGRSGGAADIYGARVSAAGALLDPTGFAISTAVDSQGSPAVASDGTNFLVAWVDGRATTPSAVASNIFAARVSAAGIVQDLTGFAVSALSKGQSDPAVAWNGTLYLVVWSDGRNSPTVLENIYGATVGTAGQIVTPEFLISNSANREYRPSVAAAGATFLVVWEDWRSGFDVYGTRVSTAGAVLDGAGIAIATGVPFWGYPSVASDGTNFLVSFVLIRASGDYDVYAAVVTGTGTVSVAGFPVSASTAVETVPAVTWIGSTFLLAWQDSRNAATTGLDIYGARVTATGTVSDATGFALSTAAGAQTFPALASIGSSAFGTWSDGRNGASSDVFGTVVTAGAPQSPTGLLVSKATNAELAPAMAWNGTTYLVVWQDWRSGGLDIIGTRVDPATGPLDTSGIAVSTAANLQRNPAVAWDGTRFLVVWQDLRNAAASLEDIYGARVNTTGTVADPSGIPISTDITSQLAPTVAWNGTSFLVAWQDFRNVGVSTETDIYGARVSSAGATLDPAGLVLSATANLQAAPAAASLGATSLVVWEETVGALVHVHGVQVTSAGAVVGPPDVAITTGATSETSPTVTSDGVSTYLVAWQDTRNASPDIFGGRLSSAGALQDPAGFSISTAPLEQTRPKATWDGTNFLVVWQDARDAGTAPDVYGSRVSVGGLTRDPSGIAIAVTAAAEQAPVIAARASRRAQVAYQGTGTFSGQAIPRVFTRTVTLSEVPVADAGAFSTVEDTAKTFTLVGSDADGDPLTYSITAPPTHGTLAGSGSTLTYTPAPDYAGADSLSFKVNDGFVDSPPATVAIDVTPVNDAPGFAAVVDQTVLEDAAPTGVTLTGVGPGGGTDEATQTVVVAATSSNPAVVPNPVVTGSGSTRTLTFAPALNANGGATITVTATDDGPTTDGGVSISSRTFLITVTAVNDVPVANAQSIGTEEGTAKAITLTGSDVETAVLTFTVTTAPTHGALGGSGANRTFTPTAGYTGTDSFGFKVNDGLVDSAEAIVSIYIGSINDPPVFDVVAPQTLSEDSAPVQVQVTGVGPGGGPDELAQQVAVTATSSNPTVVPNPTVTGSGATRTLTLTPLGDAFGDVTVTVTAQDDGGTANGGNDTAARTFLFSVLPVNDSPYFDELPGQTVQANSGSHAVSVTKVGSGGGAFEASQVVTLRAVSDNPAIVPDPLATGSGETRTLTFTPAQDATGTVTITVTASDDGGVTNTGVDSFPRTFTIVVTEAATTGPTEPTLSRYRWSCGCSGSGGGEAFFALGAALTAFTLRRRPRR